jgi:hypothetical protein
MVHASPFLFQDVPFLSILFSGHSRWKYTPTGKGFDEFVGIFNGGNKPFGHYLCHALPCLGLGLDLDLGLGLGLS